MGSTSSGHDLEVVDKDDYEFVNEMVVSKSQVDRRFLEFFRVMKNEKIDFEKSYHSDESEEELVFGRK